MKAAVYARVSSEEQRDRQTIELQREFARRYLRASRNSGSRHLFRRRRHRNASPQ